MLDFAISLAKDSDITNEYFRNEFLPNIELQKTKAKAWHSILRI
jgi:hypothetical protein